MRLFIISNRLPVKATKEGNGFVLSRSKEGLATGLDSLDTDIEKHWIGWPGISVESDSEKQQLQAQLQPLHCYPVFLSGGQLKEYDEEYNHSAAWPPGHYFFSYTPPKNGCWMTYRQINELFYKTALPWVSGDDMIWILDYRLMLLPALLRHSLPRICIGYIHSIPYPFYELFRMLPENGQFIKGLLGSDLVAFHTEDDTRYFMIATQRISGINYSEGEVQLTNRIVHVHAFPMGINYSLYYNFSLDQEVGKFINHIRQVHGNTKLILTVEHLTDSKSILLRLEGFALFLKNHPEYHEKITLFLVVVPCWGKIEPYADLKNRIDETIRAINGEFATIGWMPIRYYSHSFTFAELVALYHGADIALVTPLRNSTNLVAQEYIAAKRDRPGVLILSKTAGKALELTEALLVNPNDINEIQQALLEALRMPEKEQLAKLHRMQAVLARQNADKRATDFVVKLKDIHRKNELLRHKFIENNNLSYIRQMYRCTGHRLIILNYDGTLVDFTPDPKDCYPTPELIDLLTGIATDRKNTVVICSGRDHETLEKWLGHLPLRLAAEHGVFLKENGIWHEKPHREIWNDEIVRLLHSFIKKTPGTMLEIKRTSLVWHYRNIDSWLGFIRERQLVEALKPTCQKLDLQIVEGNKIVEIKSPEYTKGEVVRRLLSRNRYDFFMAIGDDVTDEDLFRALPPEAITIKIGALPGCAKYHLFTPSQTLPFLQRLIGH